MHKLLPPVYGPQRPCLISLYRRFTPPTVLSLTPLPRSLIHTPPRQVSTANASPTPDVEDNNQDPLHPQYEGSEFPRLVGFLGEEECSLDALLESEREPSVSEQALEQEEAWRLLRCWCVFAEVLSFDPLALCWFTNYLKLIPRNLSPEAWAQCSMGKPISNSYNYGSLTSSVLSPRRECGAKWVMLAYIFARIGHVFVFTRMSYYWF